MKIKQIACCLLLVLAGTAHAQALVKVLPAQDCEASQLSTAFSSGNGEFVGMSHSGTRLAIRNTFATACRLQRMPTVAMKGSVGQVLEVNVIPASNPFRVLS